MESHRTYALDVGGARGARVVGESALRKEIVGLKLIITGEKRSRPVEEKKKSVPSWHENRYADGGKGRGEARAY